MPSRNQRNITKEVLTHLDPAPVPEVAQVLEVRFGKLKDLYGEPSGIYKEPRDGPVYVSSTGLSGDEHKYPPHGGYERAVMGYDADHYADWRCEPSPHPELFQYGGFGENLVIKGLTEENVCIGDVYSVGKDVRLEVSEGRNPCYKLNKRFQWSMALRRVTNTVRTGWLCRVPQTGYIQKGDEIRLLRRPHPRWSVLNVKRVIQAKTVPLELIQELIELPPLTEIVRGYAITRMITTKKRYTLIASEKVSARVKYLTFQCDTLIRRPDFPPYAFARIDYGPQLSWSRAYSIVSGDLNQFCLGVALDDHSRGGSAYIHNNLKIGDEIEMAPGNTPEDVKHDEKCVESGCVENRIVIIGGIGVTAFLPSVAEWEADGLPYEVHYAVRSPEDASFLDMIPPTHLKLYARSDGRRLDVNKIIPLPTADRKYTQRIFTCGPSRLMDAVKKRTDSLSYPPHLLHFESFGTDGGAMKGPPFNVTFTDPDTEEVRQMTVPEDKSLLRTLLEAGFAVSHLCEVGGCGACKVHLCKGKVQHNGSGLPEYDKENFMLSCVDRGLTDIEIALDD